MLQIRRRRRETNKREKMERKIKERRATNLLPTFSGPQTRKASLNRKYL
jgi:hypothetical protein